MEASSAREVMEMILKLEGTTYGDYIIMSLEAGRQETDSVRDCLHLSISG